MRPLSIINSILILLRILKTIKKAEFLRLIRRLENRILIFLIMLSLGVLINRVISNLRKLGTLLSVKMRKLKRRFNRIKKKLLFKVS